MIRVLIVGCGGIAESHLRAYQALQGPAWRLAPEGTEFQITAVADIDAGRAKRFGALAGGAPWFTDYRDALALADAVDICATSHRHVELGVEAARQGKHVLVEKPVALTPDGAAQLIEACESAGVKLMVAQTARFQAAHRTVKGVIERGEIGRPVFARVVMNAGHFWPGGWRGWQIDARQSGGIFPHLGIHTLDLVHWLFDVPPVSVYAQAQKRASAHMDLYDYCQFVVKFKDEATAIGELSYDLPRRGDVYRRLSVIGTEGSAYSDLTDTWLQITDVGLRFADEGLDPAIVHQVAHFLGCVAADKAPMTTPRQIRTALAMAMAAEESVRTGEVVAVEGVA